MIGRSLQRWAELSCANFERGRRHRGLVVPSLSGGDLPRVHRDSSMWRRRATEARKVHGIASAVLGEASARQAHWWIRDRKLNERLPRAYPIFVSNKIMTVSR